MAGPLEGIRIIEIAGIGPGPFCAMMLADHGADVIRVDRPGKLPTNITDPLERSRSSIVVDLKQTEGVRVVRDLVQSADGIIEGFRPGVMERLGLGPEVLLADNPALVFGRMTGWGQSGSYAAVAGHDINYIALAGALHTYGREGEKPTPPINAVGDFGGGGMMLAFGMVCAIMAARESSRGQVIDCAMTEGAAVLATMIWGFHARGAWREERGTNFIDSGSHFYDTYECADGRFVSIGSVEPQFYALLRRLTGVDKDPSFDAQMDRSAWKSLKVKLEAVFKTRTRDEWCALMEQTDVCFAPVLSMTEAPDHPHHLERGTFREVGGVMQPMPSPRYSLTTAAVPRPAPVAGADTDRLLESLGYGPSEIEGMRARGVVA